MTKWWHRTPMRLVQTNLREIDVARNSREIVREVAEFGGNAILFSVGGIVSFYPTQLEFQTRVPGAPDDFVQAAVDEAHARGMRFIARLDLSKCHKHVYERHPEWFFRRADGDPQVYNGLYSTCVNGDYYREYGLRIIDEIASLYDVDGFFFNMFGYKSTDYSGNYHGLCQCANCGQRFRDMYGLDLPLVDDMSAPGYRQFVEFRRVTVDEVSARVAAHIHEVAPNAAFVTYQSAIEHVDILRSESNTKLDRPLPLWHLSGWDNAKRGLGTMGGPVSDAAVHFFDIPYRFAAVSPHLTALRLAQNLAAGSGLDLYVLGTLAQEDTTGLPEASGLFRHHREHEAAYTGLRSLARTCLILPERSLEYGLSSQDAYRGCFRLLTENHIPFDVALASVLGRETSAGLCAKYDRIVLPGAACLSDAQCATLDEFVAAGGMILATGETSLYDELGRARERFGLSCLGAKRVLTRRPSMRSAYLRIAPAEQRGGLQGVGLIPLDGPYQHLALKAQAETRWSLVPPCTFGPPEKVWIDKVENDLPGAILAEYGQGKSIYIPWEMDRLYYRHSLPGHAGAFCVLWSEIAPGAGQIETDAHASVELGLLRNRAGQVLLTLVNGSGHLGTASHAPVPMHDIHISIELPGAAVGARALALDKKVDIITLGGRAELALERLDLFETVVIDLVK